MKMKKIHLSIVFLFLAFTSFAQPGYLGKRMTLTYNLNGSPLVTGINYQGYNKVLTDFNLIHSLRFDYVTSRKNSIGLQVGYFRTGLYKENYYNSDSYNAYSEYNSGSPFKLHSFQYGMNFRFYFNDEACLAPFGGYSELSIGVDQQFVYDAVVEDYYSPKYVPYISVAWGTQRVYFDKLLFDISFRASFYPQSILDEWDREVDMNSLLPEQRITQLQRNGIRRTQMLDMFTLKIGFGTLL